MRILRCLAPRGASGLKYKRTCHHRHKRNRLAPRGASGLKLTAAIKSLLNQCLAPRGASGLKFL